MSLPGLGCYPAGVERLEDDPLRGASYETFVAQNLLGILSARRPRARLYFWNIQGRAEIDFIIDAGRNCLALEIKASARRTDRDLAGLKSFLSFTPPIAAWLSWSVMERRPSGWATASGPFP